MLLDLLVFLAITLICLIYGFAVPLVVQRVVGTHTTDEIQDVASSVGFRISVLYSLIIGILVAGLVSEYSEVMERVHAEAVELVRTNETLLLLNSEQAQTARRALGDYARSLVVDEWDRIGGGAPDSATREYLRRLQKAALALNPETPDSGDIQTRVREQVSKLSEYRVRRFLSSTTHGIYIFWLLGVVGFTALLIQFGYFSRSRPGSFIIGVFSIMQATVFFVALVASSPFREPGAISPEALERSIELIEKQTVSHVSNEERQAH